MSSPILITKPTLPPFEEYISLIHNIWENRWLTNSGPLYEELKEDLRKYLGVQNISLYTNGHNALEAALHAVNLPQGSEVITTPYTFASTTHSIVRNGLKPVFCDISYDDYNIDVTKIEALITEKTSAILPVHVYGTPCDVVAIDAIAKKYNLKVIYDAAHAFGVKLHNKPLCVYGDVSMLSFHATKVFNTVEGGAVVSGNPEVIAEADKYRNFGMVGQEDFDEPGTNAKMSEFHAAMGICNLKHVDESIARRKKICEAYDAAFKWVDGIKILSLGNSVTPNYAYYPVVIENSFCMTRDELCSRLAEHNIFARKYFYPIVTEFSCYNGMYDSAKVPVAMDVSRRVLSLPLYDTMTDDEVESIINQIVHK